MATYQIPQFLDSGDKILGPMNMRQFGYALVAFFISAGLFAGLSALGSIVAVIVISPIAALGAYLALGKFNGRDAEIYVLKTIIYLTKPRKMIYTRKPYVDDLDSKMAQWTPAKIEERWKKELGQQIESKSNVFSGFREVSSQEKAEKIRMLGNALDSSLINTLSTVRQKNISNEAKKALVQLHQTNIPTPGANILRTINPNFNPNAPKPNPALNAVQNNQTNRPL